MAKYWTVHYSTTRAPYGYAGPFTSARAAEQALIALAAAGSAVSQCEIKQHEEEEEEEA